MGTGDGRFYGFVTNNFSNLEQGKMEHDTYQVYVKDDFVGNKTLLNQSDQLSDVDDFLRKNGIDSFETSLEGDHYRILPLKQEDQVLKALEVYFKNR
ncbi:hypothetical protein FZC79_11580 [Rossellomorea vietnamensis]|uniref:Uncharacterized protein n=2 Tax=Rossellomorea TaxID=2837508 RepID=A0A5D4KFL4_9BACI|nr:MULTISPECIES: hypothetical protein [Rossellomorea]TYR75053.1 hypothetical protein FZC79_11580 [Rossellomorea vietnamensis]TYS79809.1 hypothetical protein FZC80_09230 [Rossellomorea aquimaris]